MISDSRNHPIPGSGRPKPKRKPKPLPVKNYPQGRCLYAYDAQVILMYSIAISIGLSQY